MKKFVCAVFCLAIFATIANAQCGRPTYTYSNTYQYPVREVVVREVITPIAVPVLVPAFQFQYVAPCAAATSYGAASPVAAQQGGASMQQASYGAAPGVGVPGTPGVAPAGAASGSDQVSLLAKALLAEMSKQSGSQGQEDNGPPMATGDFLGGSQQPQQTQQLQSQGLNGISVLANRCASCHTGPTAKVGVQIFTSPGVFNQYVDKQRIIRAVSEGRMPPAAVADSSFRLSPQEIDAIKALQ